MRHLDTTQAVTRPRIKPEQAKTSDKGLAIGKEWRIGADTLNIILYRREVNRKTQEERWRVYGYYPTLKDAFNGLIDQDIRDTKLTDTKTICDKIDQLRRDILKAIEKVNK